MADELLQAAPVRAAVVGASGYTGAELLRLLARHPLIHVVGAYARRAAGTALVDLFPSFRGQPGLDGCVVEAFDADAVAAEAEVAFAALPHGASAKVVGQLVERGLRVVDLSADFRLRSAQEYARWYGSAETPEHPAPQLIEQAVYGLPERHRSALGGARLVAAPGCYPTSVILGLAPLLAAGLLRPRGIVVDSKSGASGAGREPGLGTHLPEVGEGIRAYKVAGTHRHTAEMAQELSLAAGEPVTLTFSPHLVPMTRGILSCMYADPTDGATEAACRDALEAAYRSEPFVSVLPAGALPDTAHVRGSNRAHVTVRFDAAAGKVVVLSVIDNLGKGAAGQAIQCLNAALGWPETTGLEAPAVFP